MNPLPRFIVRGFVVTWLALLATRPATAATIISAFDVDDESWTASGAVVTHEAADGNPGGFIRITDNASDTAAAIFPTKFLGNLLAFDGGALTYDFLVLEPRIHSPALAADLAGFG